MLTIPENYKLKLLPETTEVAIKEIKSFFQRKLTETLNLRRVTAPLLVLDGGGLNDDDHNVSAPVTFETPAIPGCRVELVQSLAKWKRVKLGEYDIAPGYGLYTVMKSVRPDVELDNYHSLYVDQWDWEMTIRPEDRNLRFLKETVTKIYAIVKETEAMIYSHFPHITPTLPDEITFVHAEDLEMSYPDLDPAGREAVMAEKFGAVFIIGIGAPLGDGRPHGFRSPDYDDWSTSAGDGVHFGLNGDIVLWDTVLQRPMELSSMGIRVNAAALRRQLEVAGCPQRAEHPFHRDLLEGRLPQSIGGGIGQSRLAMFLLQKAHIGEVQASVWPAEQVEACKAARILLL